MRVIISTATSGHGSRGNGKSVWLAGGDDARRIEFIRRALKGVGNCMDEGIPVKGYLHWSLIDNFEWQKGFGMTFGLIAVDRATQIRTPKPSLDYLGSCNQKNKN